MADRNPNRGDRFNKAHSYKIFDRIYKRYDLLNRVLSFGQDILWRNRVSKLPAKRDGQVLLDLGSGTGDILLTILKKRPEFVHAVGLDLSSNMLSIARRKSEKIEKRNVSFVLADASLIPFDADSFDLVSMAFGIRNTLHPSDVLRESYRVLKPGGILAVLEFSLPKSKFIKRAYLFYLRKIVPKIGALISGDSEAYRYLNDTIEDFPYGDKFAELMTLAGFKAVRIKQQTFGVSTLYIGTK